MILNKLNNINGINIKCGIPSVISIKNDSTEPAVKITYEDSSYPRIKIDTFKDSDLFNIKVSDLFNGKGGNPTCKIEIDLPDHKINLNIDSVKSGIVIDKLKSEELRIKNIKGSLKIKENSLIKKMLLKLVSVESEIEINKELISANIESTKGNTKINVSHFQGILACKAVGSKTILNDMIIGGNFEFKNNSSQEASELSCKSVGGNLIIESYNLVALENS